MSSAPTVTRRVTNVRSRPALFAALALLLCVSGCGAASTARPAPSATASSEQPSDQGGSEGTQADLARWLLSAEELDQLSSFNEVTVEVEKPSGRRLTFPVEIPDPNYLQVDYRKGCKAAVQAMQAPQPGVNTVVVADYSEDEDGFSGDDHRLPKARVMAFRTDEEVDIMRSSTSAMGCAVMNAVQSRAFIRASSRGRGRSPRSSTWTFPTETGIPCGKSSGECRKGRAISLSRSRM